MTRSLHLDISGMSCGHCVMAVSRGLKQVAGVDVRQVNVGTADLTYDDEKTSPAAIAQAVEEAGYAVSHQQ
jgi:copper chaperone CopZ